MSSAQKIADWVLEIQRKTRACPKVWAVYIKCDGERDIDAVYETKEAAELHRDWYNRTHNAYFGRASVGSLTVRTPDIATTIVSRGDGEPNG